MGLFEFETYLPKNKVKIKGIQNFENGKPEVIAFHGWLDNCYSFRPMFDHLSDIRLLAVDLPGHGHSDHPPWSPMPHFIDYVFLLTELLLILDSKSCNLLGHSMGGAAASLFAGTFPDKVKSLSLIEAIGPLSLEEEKAPERLALSISAWLKHGHRPNPYYSDFEGAVATRQKSGLIPQAAAQLLAERGTQKEEGGIQWRHHPKLKVPSPRSFSERQVLSYIKNISAPTKVILGSSSWLQDSEYLDERIASLQRGSTETFSGGHHVHMEESEKISNCLRSFWNKYK